MSHLTSLGFRCLLCNIKVNNVIATPISNSNIVWYKFRYLKSVGCQITILPLHLILQLEFILFPFIFLLDVSANKLLLNSRRVRMKVVSWEYDSNIVGNPGFLNHHCNTWSWNYLPFFPSLKTFPKTAMRNVGSLVFKRRLNSWLVYIILNIEAKTKLGLFVSSTVYCIQTGIIATLLTN